MNPSPPRDLVITAAKASSPHFERCPHPRDGDRFTCPGCRAAFDTAHYALAAVLPAHAEMVLRAATKQQWAQMLTELADEAMETRGRPAIDEAVKRGVDERLPAVLAECEKAVRAKVIAGIKEFFAPADSYDDVDLGSDIRILCGRIERGEY